MGYYKWCWVVRGIGLIAAVFYIASMINETNGWLRVIGVSFLIIGLIVAAVKLRCPKCGKRIPEEIVIKIKACPHCGERLK